MGAEQEDVAAHALDRPVLADSADERIVWLGDDAVVANLRDGAAVQDRRHSGAATAMQHVIDSVTVKLSGGSPGAFADALAHHFDNLVEVLAAEIAVLPRPAHQIVKVVFGPVLAGAFGDDLLGEDIERCLRLDDAVEAASAHGPDEGGALDEFVAACREDAALRSQTEGVTGASDALQEGRHASRRADLADEVDAADVDAQFQGGGRDECFEFTVLEALLNPQTAVTREAAVMAHHRSLAETLTQVVSDTLRHPPRIDEDKGCPMSTDQTGEAVIDVAPLLLRRHGLEVRWRHFDVKVDIALVAEVDDRNR